MIFINYMTLGQSIMAKPSKSQKQLEKSIDIDKLIFDDLDSLDSKETSIIMDIPQELSDIPVIDTPVAPVVEITVKPLSEAKKAKEKLKMLVHPSRIEPKKVKANKLKLIGKPTGKSFNIF